MRTAYQILEECRAHDLHVRICPWLQHEELWMDGKFYAWCSSRTQDIERLFQRALSLTDDELKAFRDYMQWRGETQFKGMLGDTQPGSLFGIDRTTGPSVWRGDERVTGHVVDCPSLRALASACTCPPEKETPQ